MKKQFLKIVAVVLVTLIFGTSLVGCDKNQVTTQTKILNSNGSYILETLTPVKASEIRQENGRSVIYHNDKPYLYYTMHLRYDHLLQFAEEDYAKKLYDQAAKTIKDDGFDTIVIYIKWENIYDGKKYDFSTLEFQYNVAKKYDLKIHINWFGADVGGWGGYMAWQKGDTEKYPPLKDENGNIVYNNQGEPIPDFSNKNFLKDGYDAIQQLCAWLNVNDTDKRTVAIQLENEPGGNAGGGQPYWMGQYKNLSNYLNNLGKAVKESSYSMVTYLNLMASGWNETLDGFTFEERIYDLIDKEYIDIVGYDYYTIQPDIRINQIEYGDNLPVFVEFGPCTYAVPGQINHIFDMGYGLGFYQFVHYLDTKSNNGFYRFSDVLKGIEKRDGTQFTPSMDMGADTDGLSGVLEVDANVIINQNKAIKALRELIATQNADDIHAMNYQLVNGYSMALECNGEDISYICKVKDQTYGGSALVIHKDGEFYLYTTHTSTLTFESKIESVTVGSYNDGKWIKNDDVDVNNNTFTANPGLAYKISIK